MRLGFALNAALALGVLTASNTDAFSVPVAFTRTSSAGRAPALGMAGAWDNDNFLANLSGSGPAKEGESKPTAAEGSMGGTRFAEMMAKARDAPPRSAYTPPPPPRPSNAPPPTPAVDLSKLTTEEQAALFRQFMANAQPPAAATDTYAPPLQPPQKTLLGGTDVTGRKTGRNRDADSIANTSDLYFAQLKKDSSIRQRAFFYGDDDVADAVFADPAVKEIPSRLTVNPFLDREDTAEELALMELVDGELSIIRESLKAAPALDVTTAGVKYKDKLMAKKKVKTGEAATVAPSPVVSPSIPAPVVQEIPEPVVQQTQVPVAPAPVVQQAPVSVAPAPVVQQVPVPVAPAPVVQQAPVPVAPVARAPRTAEESRQDIRTLQGLLLKHRGGSGFGSGLLRGEEVNKFEATVQDVVASLRSEADGAPPAASVVTPVIVAPVVQVAPPVLAAAGAAEKMGPTLACVEGAVLMYKNSPLEMQSIMAPTLRAALVAAVATCTAVIGDGGGTSVAATLNPADAAARMMPTLACVEGAVQMYKNSPPELQPIMAMTVRAALLAAVTTCDQVIGGGMSQQPASVAVPVAVPAPVQIMATPAPVQVVAAAPAAVVAEPVTQSTSYGGDDANSQFLQGVYNSLVAASGGEKYGLKNLSPSEASALADQVHEMKGILAGELSSGIPDPVGASAGGTTSSRYQEMLAKARADKTAGK